MTWRERMEQYLRRLAFPGLLRHATFLAVIAFACQWLRPDLDKVLDFNRDAIFHGEIWRIFTFVITPGVLLPPEPMSLFVAILAINLAFIVGDSMEALWGTVRVTLYLLVAWAGLLFVHFAFNFSEAMAGGLIFSSMFFAFATCFPRAEFRLLFIIPVPAKYLAFALGLLLLAGVCNQPLLLAVIIPAMIPYFIWVLPDLSRNRISPPAAPLAAEPPPPSAPDSAPAAFHCCEVCGRTEKTDRHLDFRTLPDGREFCTDHLPGGDAP